MMKLINHQIGKVIWSKVLRCQIFASAKRCYRSKNHRFSSILLLSVKKAIIIWMTYILKRYCCLLQDFFSMRNKQDSLILCRIKCSQIRFPHTCCSMNQTTHSTLCPAILQCTKSFDLCPSWLEQQFNLCIRINLVISCKIFCNCRFMPVLRIRF